MSEGSQVSKVTHCVQILKWRSVSQRPSVVQILSRLYTCVILYKVPVCSMSTAYALMRPYIWTSRMRMCVNRMENREALSKAAASCSWFPCCSLPCPHNEQPHPRDVSLWNFANWFLSKFSNRPPPRLCGQMHSFGPIQLQFLKLAQLALFGTKVCESAVGGFLSQAGWQQMTRYEKCFYKYILKF